MFYKLKLVVCFLKIAVSLLYSRPFETMKSIELLDLLTTDAAGMELDSNLKTESGQLFQVFPLCLESSLKQEQN